MKKYKMTTEEILKTIDDTSSDNKLNKFINSLDLTNKQFEILSEHKEDNVRFILAKKDDLPMQIIYKFGKDKEDAVREAIAERSYLPVDLMYKMAEDENPYIRDLLAEREDLPENLMYKLAENKDRNSSWSLSLREDLPKDLLIKLSCDPTVSNDTFDKMKKIKNLNKKDIKRAYDLIRNSDSVNKRKIENTFNILIYKFPDISRLAILFKNLLVK